MKALRIDTDGTMQMVDITGSTIKEQNDCIWGILGGYFDCVRMTVDAKMLVNDEGALNDLPANPAAMLISGYPLLFGTALVVGLEDTPDGAVFTDCPHRYTFFAQKENA